MEPNKSGQVALTVMVSSLLTTLIVVLALFSFREQLTSFLLSDVVLPSERIVESEKLVDRELQTITTIEKVNPAVVSVVVTKDVPIYERYFETYEPWGFFGGFSIPRIRENGTEEREVGGGSGFIVSNNGLIVTNRHVVDDEEARYSVLLNDGTIYAVAVLARDPQLDIAVLRITDPLEKKLTHLTFGDSDELRLGQSVIAIGNALAEFQNSVSVGVISGLSRSIVASDSSGRSEQLEQVIQTDAAINPGNSGGPLLNLDGEVVGVNVATSQGADNIGFALPSSLVAHVVESVAEYGEIIRPFVGVRYVTVTERTQEQYDLPVSYGTLIVGNDTVPAVVPDSPADRAGLRSGDIILEIDGEVLLNRDLATVLRSKRVGDTITLLVLQDGEENTITLKLERAL